MKQQAAREILSDLQAGAWNIRGGVGITRDGKLWATGTPFVALWRNRLRAVGNTAWTRVSTAENGTVTLAPAPGTGMDIQQALAAVAEGREPIRRADVPLTLSGLTRRQDVLLLKPESGLRKSTDPEVRWRSEWIQPPRWPGVWVRVGLLLPGVGSALSQAIGPQTRNLTVRYWPTKGLMAGWYMRPAPLGEMWSTEGADFVRRVEDGSN